MIYGDKNVKSKEKLYLFSSDVQKTGIDLNSWALSFERRKVYFSLLPKMSTHRDRAVRSVLIVRLSSPEVLNSIRRVNVKRCTFGIIAPSWTGIRTNLSEEIDMRYPPHLMSYMFRG